MSSTASLIALIASTAMSGISVVRGVSEEISGMSCSLVRCGGQQQQQTAMLAYKQLKQLICETLDQQWLVTQNYYYLLVTFDKK